MSAVFDYVDSLANDALGVVVGDVVVWRDEANAEWARAAQEGAVTGEEYSTALRTMAATARTAEDFKDWYNVAAQKRAAYGTRDSAPGTGPSNAAELVPDVPALPSPPWQLWAILALGVVVYAAIKGL